MKFHTNLLPLIGSLVSLSAFSANHQKPNVIFILSDDIGYGDFSCYGAEKISTPNIDKLAANGVQFINAYAPASVSSPSRYALLTGKYAFRDRVSILPGNAPMSIDTHKDNLPKMFKQRGYRTGIVGKWHLGLGTKDNRVDFNKKIANGMEAVGFDYSFIYPATNDRVPTIYIENDRTVNYDPNDPIEVSYRRKIGTDPTAKENPEKLTMRSFLGHQGTIVNGIGRIGFMSGGNKARWNDETMAETFLNKALDYIDKNKRRPFFLYYATHEAHEPRVPSIRFRGKSKAGIYGDVIEEFDYNVGQIIKKLKEEKILDNTLIIITSDNGPRIKEAYEDGALENMNGHNPCPNLRGRKCSLYEGGTKVPFIVYWNNKIKTPFIQKQRFCFTDTYATLASIINNKKVSNFNDSKDASQLFFKKDAPLYRDYIVTQNNGVDIAIRMGDVKYIRRKNKIELYNLKTDPTERHNIVNAEEYETTVIRFNMIYREIKNHK